MPKVPGFFLACSSPKHADFQAKQASIKSLGAVLERVILIINTLSERLLFRYEDVEYV